MQEIQFYSHGLFGVGYVMKCPVVMLLSLHSGYHWIESPLSPFLNLKLKTNLYNSQKDIEISYELLTPSLFSLFDLLKATITVERMLTMIAKQTLVQTLALPFISCMIWK